MSRTKRGYEQVFEDLMEYTRFSNVNQIQTREDLRNFFKDIKEDSASKGRNFITTRKMVFAFSESVMRLGGQTKERKDIQTRKQKVTASRKVFITFEEAKKEGLVTVNDKGKAVFRSKVIRGKKTIIRFRDRSGRFAKKPTR